MGGQSRIGIIIGNWKVEIRGEVVWSGEELGDDFALARGDEFGVGIDRFVRDFVVEIAAELLGGFGGVIGGLGVVGFGGTSEEIVGVGHGNV